MRNGDAGRRRGGADAVTRNGDTERRHGTATRNGDAAARYTRRWPRIRQAYPDGVDPESRCVVVKPLTMSLLARITGGCVLALVGGMYPRSSSIAAEPSDPQPAVAESDGPAGTTFRAGTAAIEITPTEFPRIIAGSFLENQASAVNSRLFARGFVLDDGVTRLALVVVDTCMMPADLIDDAKRLAAERCDIRVDQSGRFTSACGGMIDGDDRLFGPTDESHAFICEPFHNLVQHQVLAVKGPSFEARRGRGEEEHDFFASEDRWCRPVMTRTGPDGALWVADMYRYMIEHPEWLPPEGKDELLPHYRLGDDRGRIYRVVADQIEPRDIASLAGTLRGSDLRSLVRAIDSPNAWQRDKVHQMSSRARSGHRGATPTGKTVGKHPRPQRRHPARLPGLQLPVS